MPHPIKVEPSRIITWPPHLGFFLKVLRPDVLCHHPLLVLACVVTLSSFQMREFTQFTGLISQRGDQYNNFNYTGGTTTPALVILQRGVNSLTV